MKKIKETISNICRHSNKYINKKDENGNINCLKCGSIGIKLSNVNKYEFISKPNANKKEDMISPFNIYKKMKEKTDSLFYKIKKESDVYIKTRKKIIVYLKALTEKLQYSPTTFFSALFILDTYYRNISQTEIDEQILDNITLSAYILMGKFKETSIFEPDLENKFQYMKTSKYIPVDDIVLYEILILKKMKYDLSCYSPYEYLLFFINYGYIFEKELLLLECSIKTFYDYSKKLLAMLTSKHVYYKYKPYIIAIIIVRLTREEYKLDDKSIDDSLDDIDDDDYFSALLNIYQIKLKDIKECYSETLELIKRVQTKSNDIPTHNYSFVAKKNLTIKPKEMVQFSSLNLDSYLSPKKSHQNLDSISLDKTNITRHFSNNSTDIKLESSYKFIPNRNNEIYHSFSENKSRIQIDCSDINQESVQSCNSTTNKKKSKFFNSNNNINVIKPEENNVGASLFKKKKKMGSVAPLQKHVYSGSFTEQEIKNLEFDKLKESSSNIHSINNYSKHDLEDKTKKNKSIFKTQANEQLKIKYKIRYKLPQLKKKNN